MERFRRYRDAPFRITVIHGGPGAPGEMAPVARELSSAYGVLEPLQAGTTPEGQVSELKEVLESEGELPITVIGFSWGAMLGFLLAARHPALVKKLILVGSGPFEERYATHIMDRRLERLNSLEREEALSLMKALQDPAAGGKNAALARLGEVLSGADSFDPLPHDSELLGCSFDVYRDVWSRMQDLRRSGELLQLGYRIRCPVVAIHGDCDPHPFEGVRDPLSRVVGDFRFVLLEKCGHCPWIERSAKDEFYRILKDEAG